MNRLRSMVTENVGLKFLSLGLAAGVWLAVGSAPITDASFWVPVEFINAPTTLEVLIEQPSIQVRARGPSYAVRRATPGDFVIRINLANVSGPAERSYPLMQSEVVAPAPLQVIELIPSEVHITVEETAVRVVPIDPRFSGSPTGEYRVKSYRVSPSSIRISGPASHVRAVETAETDPIDLTNLTGEKTFSTNLYVPDPLIRFVRPRTVQVTVQVEPADTPPSGT